MRWDNVVQNFAFILMWAGAWEILRMLVDRTSENHDKRMIMYGLLFTLGVVVVLFLDNGCIDHDD